jgi:membrane protein implicated in regulation of membrane protease activity
LKATTADARRARLKNTVSTDDPVVGKLGTVTHPIHPGGTGEVVVRIRGGTETYMAVSDTPLEVDTEILVVSQRSARTVVVTPFIS